MYYYDDEEIFDMFENEYTKKIILELYKNGILKKFGIENLGYEKYKDCTFELLEDIIMLTQKLNIEVHIPFIKSKNITELKNKKYEMLEEYYKNISEEKYNFPEEVKKIIKTLKENFSNITIIDNEKN